MNIPKLVFLIAEELFVWRLSLGGVGTSPLASWGHPLPRHRVCGFVLEKESGAGSALMHGAGKPGIQPQLWLVRTLNCFIDFQKWETVPQFVRETWNHSLLLM